MKRIRKFILIGFIGGIFIMSGCAGIGKTKEDVAKETLKNKYNEDFVVHEIDSFPDGFDATLSPVNNPEILFAARMSDDGSNESDDYYKQYVSFLLNQKLVPEITQLYNNCFVRTRVSISLDNDLDVRNKDIKDILDSRTGDALVYVDIYFDENRETVKIEDEYKYYGEVLDEYEDAGDMLPSVIHLYHVDDNTIQQIKKYFEKDLDVDGVYEKEVLKIDRIKGGLFTNSDTEVGTPPNMRVSFVKGNVRTICDMDEFIRRRNLINE